MAAIQVEHPMRVQTRLPLLLSTMMAIDRAWLEGAGHSRA
jgi:hypothetical protein